MSSSSPSSSFHRTFPSSPYLLPLLPGHGHKWHMYRVYLGDSVKFHASLRGRLEHGSVQNELTAQRSSEAEGVFSSHMRAHVLGCVLVCAFGCASGL